MKILEIEEKTKPLYFGLAQKLGTVFNSENWLRIYGNDISLFGIFNKDNKLSGGFYIYKGKQLGLSHFSNPPYAPHIGLFYEDKTKNNGNRLSHNKSVINLISEFIESLN